ncbi:trimethoprim-resistant dihydrofolate reductase DfrA [Desulfotalea psychrophila]|uniref:dihydrofolate reductase n=1 Tax=Desulfotalea psychrophila (strain LSv54 / DSM 12343) TaxID=177439 RepID=Q6ARI5_DESPS|nr:trimethoprim-resistant dihydrofolate reductase DfrA [Desulfotalea psychrophila]CAG35040.1 probable dihydrofolate reductase, type VII [Desulfotalea psychrophila LSv54]
MKISLMAAKSENGVIGKGADIPWMVKGEQLLFKAITFNQWLLVGRKTFDSMGVLPNRKYAVITRSGLLSQNDNVLVFPSIEDALRELAQQTEHIIVAGGGEIFKAMINRADTLHLSTVHQNIDGDITFPQVPKDFKLVFEQYFESNINYTYQIWQRP